MTRSDFDKCKELAFGVTLWSLIGGFIISSVVWLITLMIGVDEKTVDIIWCAIYFVGMGMGIGSFIVLNMLEKIEMKYLMEHKDEVA